MKNLLFDWGISDHSGWGIYGLNLLLSGIQDTRFQISPLEWPPSFLYPTNPIAALEIDRYFRNRGKTSSVSSGDILLTALGNSIEPRSKDVSLKELGIIFFEANPLNKTSIESLHNFDLIVAGSSWNRDQLSNMGIYSELVIQGINVDLFRPLDKKFLKDRFVVFSGGKLEFRKGQDIALKAFSIFSQNHDDALLISCWRSPWESGSAPTINRSNLCKPLIPHENMGVAINNWVMSNGIREHQFLDLGVVSNQLMPEVFREANLAIFPNRSEGGTNLVAMEAIGSGLPCAISANTGHLDLIQNCECLPLIHQTPVTNNSTTPCIGWGESSVDELVGVLEDAYYGRLKKLSKNTVSQSISKFTWGNSIDSLLNIANTI